MTHPSEPHDQGRADELGAFGDALVEGHAPPPGSDIERAMARAYRAMHAADGGASRMPSDVRRKIWEDLMTANTTSIDRLGRVPTTTAERPPRTSARRRVPRAMVASRAGWPAAASFALVLAVLAALVTLAWQQGAGSGDDDGSPTLAAQVLYDSDDPSTFPRVPEKCIPNGEVPSDAELASRSIDDWPAPRYTPVRAVSYDKGKAIQDTYLHYFRCMVQAFDQAYPPGWTPTAGTPVPPFEASPAMRSYFTDRLRFDHMYDSLSPEQQAALDAYRCEPRIDTILGTFPLPVNQPNDYAVTSLLANGDIDDVALVFSPADVYLMPDGRYGAIMGTVSPAALAHPDAATTYDNLEFIAFVEKDGRYYIDEQFTLLTHDMDGAFPDGRNGTIVTDCD